MRQLNLKPRPSQHFVLGEIVAWQGLEWQVDGIQDGLLFLNCANSDAKITTLICLANNDICFTGYNSDAKFITEKEIND